MAAKCQLGRQQSGYPAHSSWELSLMPESCLQVPALQRSIRLEGRCDLHHRNKNSFLWMNMQRCRKPEGFKDYRAHYNNGNGLIPLFYVFYQLSDCYNTSTRIKILTYRHCYIPLKNYWKREFILNFILYSFLSGVTKYPFPDSNVTEDLIPDAATAWELHINWEFLYFLIGQPGKKCHHNVGRGELSDSQVHFFSIQPRVDWISYHQSKLKTSQMLETIKKTHVKEMTG